MVVSTTNSQALGKLIQERGRFDAVVIEEAAKITGPELVAPLSLAGRALLIGDHRQLPPFDAERLEQILADYELVTGVLNLAEQYVGSVISEEELDNLDTVAADRQQFEAVRSLALRLVRASDWRILQTIDLKG